MRAHTLNLLLLATLLGSCAQSGLTATPARPADASAPATAASDAADSLSQAAVSYRTPPSGKVVWDWQIGAEGDSAIKPPTGAKLIDVDGWGTSASKVAQLKAQGLYTVCYLDVGSWEPGRPDSNQYPSYLKIQQDPDWEDEYFLDVTDVFKPNSALARILKNRFAMCKQKGFDALEPDNLQNDENISGRKRPTLQQQIDFNGWVADAAHAAGLAVFQKNGPDKILVRDRTGKMMVEKFDGILNEQCQEYGECNALGEYSKRGKLVLDTEYDANLNCSLSNSLKLNMIKRDLDLKAPGQRGYKRSSC